MVLGMQLMKRQRVKAKLRDDRKEERGPNVAWAMNFLREQLAKGRKIGVPTVVIRSRTTPYP